jgi:hypothetical protein
LAQNLQQGWWRGEVQFYALERSATAVPSAVVQESEVVAYLVKWRMASSRPLRVRGNMC